VILPKDNERDLEEIPSHVRKDLKFHFIESADEAIEIALLPAKEPPAVKGAREKSTAPVTTHITGHA
jgi:ATP-dependent Lon protease